MQNPRRRRLRRAAGVGVLAVLGVVLLVGGSATAAPAAVPTRVLADDDPGFPAPPAPLQPYTDCDENDGTPLSSTPYATGLPVIPCLTYTGGRFNRYQDGGSLFGGIAADVGVPKLKIALEAAVGRAFYTVCNGTVQQPCPAGFDVELPEPEFPTYFGVVAQVYMQSPLGTSPQYGTFAPVTVSTMAFGSIPVSARVTVRQGQSNGAVVPLQLVWGSAAQVPAGTEFGGPLARYGPAPQVPGSSGAILFPEAHVTGPVTITLDQVTVDRVPLDVGSSCTSATKLDLSAPGGWVDGDAYGLPASQGGGPQKGKPGAYNPFTTPSFLTANLDIPAFQGCLSAAGEDLDPLVTGLISGRNNTLDVTQLRYLGPFACLPYVDSQIDSNACPGDAYTTHPPTVDPTKIPIPVFPAN